MSKRFASMQQKKVKKKYVRTKKKIRQNNLIIFYTKHFFLWAEYTQIDIKILSNTHQCTNIVIENLDLHMKKQQYTYVYRDICMQKLLSFIYVYKYLSSLNQLDYFQRQ